MIHQVLKDTDFRQDYAKLSSLKQTFLDTPLIAVTASADEATKKDISKTLNLNQPKDILSFSLISGVGKKKLEDYGKVFLKEILDHGS